MRYFFIFVFAALGYSDAMAQAKPAPAVNAANQAGKPQAAKKLEFEDQSINALDPDYGKLDLTSVKDAQGHGGRLYPVRKDFKKEQQEAVKNWGIVE